ncbi:MAG: hypothetical protein ABSG41_16550 [Bryobacteraceae bacterium]|jgi:hypothetical protein
MEKKIPPPLEVLRSAESRDFRCVDLEGMIAKLTLDGIADVAPTLEKEWENHSNSTPFRILSLRLLARLAVRNSIAGLPVSAEFWETVARSGNATDRRIAILACNMSEDERLWNLLAKTWRHDPRGLNRALALETMGTTGHRDPHRRNRTIGEYGHAISGSDLPAKFGALHGSLFFRENAAEQLARRVIGHEKSGELIALAFTILLARNPGRARRVFTAILGYAIDRRPAARTTAMLLGVCALCHEAATRSLCRRLLTRPSDPRFEALRAGARYVLEHGQGRPSDLHRRTRLFAGWPVPPS